VQSDLDAPVPAQRVGDLVRRWASVADSDVTASTISVCCLPVLRSVTVRISRSTRAAYGKAISVAFQGA
jgi:hypothetical protein